MNAADTHALSNMLLTMKYYFKTLEREPNTEKREVLFENALRLVDSAMTLVQRYR